MSVTVQLSIEKGPLTGHKFEFACHDTLIFGRSKRDCHVSLQDDGYISRHHFILEVNPPQVQIRDLGSRNGTYVNGIKYGGRNKNGAPGESSNSRFPTIKLSNGDVIRVGKTLFRLTINGEGHPPTIVANAEQPATPSRVPTGKMNLLPCHRCGKTFAANAEQAGDSPTLCDECNSNVSDRFRVLKEAVAQSDEFTPQFKVPGYNIADVLGQGGMGVVYRGIRASDLREVAIKTIISRAAVDPRSRDEFLRECEVLNELSHPNVVEFIDVGVKDSIIYCVMEFCSGSSLASYFASRGKPISPETLTRLFLPLKIGRAHV